MGFAKTVNRAAKRKFRAWLGLGTALSPAAPVASVPDKPKRLFSPAAMADLAAYFGAGHKAPATWNAPPKPAWVEKWLADLGTNKPALAMDSVPFDDMADYATNSSPWSEGLGFMGYAYLAELWQRPEYRRISEIWAAESTRKWIKLKGDNPERLDKLEALLREFGVREKFREAVELDGGFGRAHIFMDFGDRKGERGERIEHTPETVPVGGLKNLKVVEPYWCYPLQFNTMDPLADEFYAPNLWQVMGDTVHNTRMLTFVGRELPDMLKPVYMFGGLSLSQMAKPYIDNFIRNRTSVANLLYSFSTMVLSTNMSVMLSPEGAQELIKRIQTYVFAKDNGGLMVVDKETEELTNVSAPISGVDKLLAQAQEFISSVVGIPLVVLLGVTPSGLNASSEGELKAFYAHIKGYQEKALQAPLSTVLRVLQLHLDGKIDDGITFEFIDLWELDDEAKARVRQTNMTVDTGYIQAGVLDPEDVRERLKQEEGGLYFGVELKEPELPEAGDYDDEDGDAPGGGDGGDGLGDDPGEDDDGLDLHPDKRAAGLARLRKAANDTPGILLANDALPLAMDDSEHWITVHPNGKDDKGTPLLVKSAGGGSYTVLGGAGGKLNGKTLKPGSMSKPRGGTGASTEGNGGGSGEEPNPYARQESDTDESAYAHRLSKHAHEKGTAYAHQRAEAGHREAREAHLERMRTREHGPERDAAWNAYQEHGQLAEAHRKLGLKAEHGPQWATHVANKATEATALLPAKPKTPEEWAAHNRAHNEASRAHLEAHEEGRTNGMSDEQRREHYRASRAHSEEASKARRKLDTLAKAAKKKEAVAAAEAHVGEEGMARIKELEGRYAKHTPEEVHNDWSERWGLGLFNDASAKAKREKAALTKSKEFRDRYWSNDPETREAARAELDEIHGRMAQGHANRIRGHSPVDLTDNTASAKEQRKMLGHVEGALEHLKERGFDIAGALKEAKVHYTPAGTKNAFGHAYQYGGGPNGQGREGFFSMSTGKNALDYRAQQMDMHQKRTAKGQSPWSTSTSSDLEHMTRTTIIHELAHALGMQGHINSPGRLSGIMAELYPDPRERHAFIHKNISEYATSNPLERDAELAALVTRHDYQPGTLPKELEDHVAWLFNPKKGK